MIKKVIETVEITNVLSDDGSHRYLQKRVWDVKGKMAVVITIHPGNDQPLQTDLTTMLIQNQLVELGFGGAYLANLFSSLAVKSTNKQTLKTGSDTTTDEVFESAFSDRNVKAVIVATGALVRSNPIAQERLEALLGKLTGPKSKMIQYLVNDRDEITHPLAPIVRSKWVLKKLDFTVDKKKVNVKDKVTGIDN